MFFGNQNICQLRFLVPKASELFAALFRRNFKSQADFFRPCAANFSLRSFNKISSWIRFSLRMGETISAATWNWFGRVRRKFRCAWAKQFELHRKIDLVESAENFAAHGRTSLNRAFEKLLPITDIFMLQHFNTI